MSATSNVLASFDSSDGQGPNASLIADASGDLFGTASGGGANNDGTIFEITYNATTGYAETPTVLSSFDGTDGATPEDTLLADANGDLFGTTEFGGANGSGTVFELAKTASGYASAPTVLASFGHGALPRTGLVADTNGDLFGVTGEDGVYGGGTVFEIAKTASGYASAPTIVATFNGLEGGYFPSGGLIIDKSGDLFGTTDEGGANGYGTAFEIAKTASGYAGTPTVLVNFDADTEGLFGSLVADANGDLFGTSADGGAYKGGAVFEIAKTATGYASTPTVLASFNGPVAHSGPELNTDGSYPVGTLIIDAQGNLFGTTQYGGATGDGTAFEIARTTTGYASTPTVLHSFSDSGGDGGLPVGGLLSDADGRLLGTTQQGGANNDGSVYKLTDTGFTLPSTGPTIFTDVQAAATGPLTGDFLWSNPSNWTRGVPVDGADAASRAAGIDEIPSLSLNSLDLNGGGSVGVTHGLTVQTLTGDASSELLASTTSPGSATADIVTVANFAVTGGTYGARGSGAVFEDTSVTSPANATYLAESGGELQVANDLAIGGAAFGSLSVQSGGTATSVNGNIGTGTGTGAASADVDGPGSTWLMSGALTIGTQGGTGSTSLTVSDGAGVTTSSNPASDDYVPDGTLTLETGGHLTESELDLHDAATLTVESGAVLTETGPLPDPDMLGLSGNGTMIFDDASLASPNRYTVVGLTTKLGGAGVGTLTASDGSSASSLATDLGEYTGDTGTLTLTGSGTSWTDTYDTPVDSNDAGINIGVSGTGSLTVASGATLTNPLAYIKIGQFSGSTGTALVTGSGSTLSAGGLLRVGDSGTGTLGIENDGTVSAGQVQVSDYANSVGKVVVGSGSTLTTDAASAVDVGPQRIINDGTIDVAAGSFDIAVQTGSEGYVDVDGGAVTVQGDLTVGNAGTGSLSVEDGGVVSAVTADIGTGAGIGNVTLGIDGTFTATAVTVGAQGTVTMAGGVLDPPDQVAIDAGGLIDGAGKIVGDVIDAGTLTALGGTLALTGSLGGTGTTIIDAGAELDVGAGVGNGQTVDFAGAGTLRLDEPTEFDGAIAGLQAGDVLVLSGDTFLSATLVGSTLTVDLQNAAPLSFHVSGPARPDQIRVENDEVTVACFHEGTRLSTAHGRRRVELLAPGDLLRTLSGDLRPIVWIGRRRIHCDAHPHPDKVWPVRILAGALGATPESDLVLSPDHAIHHDGVLIPVNLLVNGTTVRQEPAARVTYFHVELATHDVILAEGQPVESYLDTGNRAMFANAPIVQLHPDMEPTAGALACPMIFEGPILADLRAMLCAPHGRRRSA